MAQNHVLQQSPKALRKFRNRADFVIDHAHTNRDMPKQLSLSAVAEASVIRKLVDLADVVQNHSGKEQIHIDILVVRSQQLCHGTHGKHMLNQSAEERVMN